MANLDPNLQNILVKSRPPGRWWVKIGDFGISKRVEDTLGHSKTLKGTLGYIAPELHGIYSTGQTSTPRNAPAADMWALGETAFRILTGHPTFPDIADLFRYVQTLESFPSFTLASLGVSILGQNFLSSAMAAAPDSRLTATQALDHAWIQQYKSELSGTSSEIASSTRLADTQDLGKLSVTKSPVSVSRNRYEEEFTIANSHY